MLEMDIIIWDNNGCQKIVNLQAAKKVTLVKRLEKYHNNYGVYRIERVSPELVDMPGTKEVSAWLEIDFDVLYDWASK